MALMASFNDMAVSFALLWPTTRSPSSEVAEGLQPVVWFPAWEVELFEPVESAEAARSSAPRLQQGRARLGAIALLQTRLAAVAWGLLGGLAGDCGKPGLRRARSCCF